MRGHKVHLARHLLLIPIILVLIILTLPLVLSVLSQLSPNEAKTEATPIEKALLAKGVQKICDEGDNGRGWDNQNPHYTMRLQFRENKQNTIVLLKDILQKQGFTLSSDSETTEESSTWYIDETSKQSPYKDLVSGPIRVSVGVFGPSQGNLSCLLPPQNILIDDTHTGVMLSLNLPDRL